ncbi:MAG: DUF6325 family protein [Methanomicrobiaceae archaeon]|nr:DUF6325 family protein [Methanomicrobiaceae archaeon]
MAETVGRVMGPVDFLVMRFPGNKFSGKIVPEIARLEQNGIIRVMDLVFVMKDETGKLVNIEAYGLGGEVGAAYRELSRRTDEWFTEGDIEAFTEALPKNSSGLLLLFENLWAIRFKEAMMDADSELVEMGRIPPETIANVKVPMKTAPGA